MLWALALVGAHIYARNKEDSMSLQQEIMNILEQGLDQNFRYSHLLAYKYGHRDARHAAAELSLKYEAYIEDLEGHIGAGVAGVIKRKHGL